ncbi:MAG: hypothetical protein LBK82_01880 [Planctomycetaceae bacterium]|nr:hypothetical protein [Planctomycetaceae bacterium]
MIPIGLPFYLLLNQKEGQTLLELSKTQPAQPPSGRIAHLSYLINKTPPSPPNSGY